MNILNSPSVKGGADADGVLDTVDEGEGVLDGVELSVAEDVEDAVLEGV